MQSLQKSVAFWVNRAQRGLARSFEARLRPAGVAMSYLPVLAAFSDGQVHTQAELAQAAGVEQPSMTETLARMERAGLVRRRPNPADRRGDLFAVSQTAVQRLPRVREALAACEREATHGLSPAQQRMLREMLQQVVANVSDGARRQADNPLCPPRTARTSSRPSMPSRQVKKEPA